MTPTDEQILDAIQAAIAAERARIAEAVRGLLPNVDFQIKTMAGHLRPMRTPADGWECCQTAVLAVVEKPG